MSSPSELDEVRSQSLIALRGDVSRSLSVAVALLAVCAAFFVIGSQRLWHASLLSVVWVIAPSGWISARFLGRYILLRRLQRLAATDLPVTPMVMCLHRAVRPIPTTPVVDRQCWAELWPLREAERSPARRAVRANTQSRRPMGSAAGPRPLRVLLLRDAPERFWDRMPVHVLGVPEPGQWVLIATDSEILWPRRRAGIGRPTLAPADPPGA